MKFYDVGSTYSYTLHPRPSSPQPSSSLYSSNGKLQTHPRVHFLHFKSYITQLGNLSSLVVNILIIGFCLNNSLLAPDNWDGKILVSKQYQDSILLIITCRMLSKNQNTYILICLCLGIYACLSKSQEEICFINDHFRLFLVSKSKISFTVIYSNLAAGNAPIITHSAYLPNTSSIRYFKKTY